MNLVGQRLTIPGESNRVERRQRIHQRDQIGRTKRAADEVGQRLAAEVRRLHLTDVILVPEDDEDADVVLGGLGRRVLGRTNGQRQVIVRRRLTGGLDQFERFDLLVGAVLADLEVVLGQVAHRLAMVIDDADVHADQVGAGAERRARLLRCGVGRLRRRCRRLRRSCRRLRSGSGGRRRGLLGGRAGHRAREQERKETGPSSE